MISFLHNTGAEEIFRVECSGCLGLGMQRRLSRNRHKGTFAGSRLYWRLNRCINLSLLKEVLHSELSNCILCKLSFYKVELK